MNMQFTVNDFMKLAETLSKPYDIMGIYPWKEYLEGWIEEFEQEDLMDLIINCFFTFYGPENLEKQELKEIIWNTPLNSLNQYLLSEPSLENPRSIFAEWRIAINK